MIIPGDIAEPAIALKDQYFDLNGLSAYCDMAVPTLRDYIKAGNLPYFKLKGKILVKRSEFDQWIERYRGNKGEDITRIVDEVMGGMKRHKSDYLSEGHRL